MNTGLLGPNGRAVIVALDHALASGQVAPLDQPVSLLQQILLSNPDGLIVSYGMQRLVPSGYSGQRWLTADYYATSMLPGEVESQELQERIWTPQMAKQFGASGLKVLLVFGREKPEVHLRNVQYVAQTVAQAKAVGLPVMVEPVLWGLQIPPHLQNASSMVAHAARIAFELGADVLKVPIPEEMQTLEALCKALPVPIVVMGGPLTDTEKLLQMIGDAMDAGAAGVALGRNIWQHPDPPRVIAALKQIVHHGARPKDTLDLLNIPRELR